MTPRAPYKQRREVYARHGVDQAMGFKFRSRVESRVRTLWFGLGKEVTEYRYVIERYYMSWVDCGEGKWGKEHDAFTCASKILDAYETGPAGAYVDE